MFHTRIYFGSYSVSHIYKYIPLQFDPLNEVVLFADDTDIIITVLVKSDVVAKFPQKITNTLINLLTD